MLDTLTLGELFRLNFLPRSFSRGRGEVIGRLPPSASSQPFDFATLQRQRTPLHWHQLTLENHNAESIEKHTLEYKFERIEKHLAITK